MNTPLPRIILLMAISASIAHSATFTWDGGAIGNNWTLDNNWNPNQQPPSDGTADLIFAGTSQLTSDANNPWSIRSIAFANNAGAFSITGQTLTIGTGGITNSDDTTQTINNAIVLSGAQTWGTTSTGVLQINGTVNNNGNLLTIAGASQSIQIDDVISGSGGLTVTGVASHRLRGTSANTYTGTTTVNGGTLLLQKTAGINSIAGDLVIGDGTGTDRVVIDVANQIANTSDVTVNASGILDTDNNSETIAGLTINAGLVTSLGGGLLTVSSLNMTGGAVASTVATLTLNGNATTNASTATASLSGDVNLGGLTRTFTVADGAAAIDLTLSGEVSNGGLTKLGAGTMRLAGNTGNLNLLTTTVSAGVLELSKTAGVNAIIGPLIVNTGATVRLLAGNQILDTADLTINGGTFDLNGFSEAIDQLTMTAGDVSTALGTLTVGGNITATASGATPAVINGTLNLGGVNRTITVADSATAPTDVTFDATIVNGGIIKAGPGTLRLAGAAANTYTGTTTVNQGTLELAKTAGINAIAGPLVIDTGVVTLVAANQIADTSPVTISNGGGLILNSLSETIGTLTLNNGDVGGGGSLTLGGDVSSSSGSNEILSGLNLGGAVRTFTVADAAAFSFEFSINGVITNGGITKAGAGTLRLVSTSSYNGATTVNAGTLLVNGSISGSTVTVNNDAVLAGSGTTGPVALAGTSQIAPGNLAVGTLTTGSLTITSGSTLRLELASPGLPGGVNDLLIINGNLTLDGTLAITELPGFANGTYRVANYTGTLTNNGLDLQAAFLTAHPGSSINTATTGQVNLVVVPEPSSPALLAITAALLTSRCRRKAPASSVYAFPSIQTF